MSAVLFDVLGTLFDLTPLEQKLGESFGEPKALLDAWFQRLLHSTATITAAGEFRSFSELARPALETEAERLGIELDVADVLEQLDSLTPYPDARSALERLAAADVRAAVLTNGELEQTRALLDTSGLADLVVAVFTAEEARAYKPDGRPYRHAVEQLGLAPAEATLIAAHGWDVFGAQAAGLNAIWVERLEKRWPFPGRPRMRASNLFEAAGLAAG